MLLFKNMNNLLKILSDLNPLRISDFIVKAQFKYCLVSNGRWFTQYTTSV
jgi:hypothetical protein